MIDIKKLFEQAHTQAARPLDNVDRDVLAVMAMIQQDLNKDPEFMRAHLDGTDQDKFYLRMTVRPETRDEYQTVIELNVTRGFKPRREIQEALPPEVRMILSGTQRTFSLGESWNVLTLKPVIEALVREVAERCAAQQLDSARRRALPRLYEPFGLERS